MSLTNLKRCFVVVIACILVLSLLDGVACAVPPVQRMALSNGLVVLFSEDHSLPFLTMQLLVQAGSRVDPAGREGLASLTAEALLLGTSRRPAAAINEELDFMGASLGASCNRDYTVVSFRILKKDLDKGLDLLMETITQPVFPEEEVRKEVNKTLAAIQAADEDPGEAAEKAFREALFVNSPYAHPVEGTKESVPGLSRELLADFHRTYYRPNNSILTIVGDITADELKTLFFSRLAEWSEAQVPDVPYTGAFAQGPNTVRVQRAITQANVILGHAGVSRDNPDYYAITVMNYILGGGGFSSRLMNEIREKRGMAYSVDSLFMPQKYPGSFELVLQTKNTSAREAISLAVQEMRKMQKELVSEKELEGAKRYLVGSFPMKLNTQGKLAGFLSQVEYYGLGLDYPEKYPSLIRRVSREDIRRVAQTYLHPDNLILAIVADLKEAGMEAAVKP